MPEGLVKDERDEAVWEEAKKEAAKSYDEKKDPNAFYGTAVKIYKNIVAEKAKDGGEKTEKACGGKEELEKAERTRLSSEKSKSLFGENKDGSEKKDTKPMFKSVWDTVEVKIRSFDIYPKSKEAVTKSVPEPIEYMRWDYPHFVAIVNLTLDALNPSSANDKVVEYLAKFFDLEAEETILEMDKDKEWEKGKAIDWLTCDEGRKKASVKKLIEKWIEKKNKPDKV